jgi:hypothetical protein
MYDSTMNISQTDVAAAESECELLMIQSELMQNRGVDVLNHQWILRDRISELIRLPKRGSTIETATRQKDRVPVDMMIASGRF